MRMPISERPQEVGSRKTFGHWELDTMVSSRAESKGCFATFVERKSRLYTAIKSRIEVLSPCNLLFRIYTDCYQSVHLSLEQRIEEKNLHALAGFVPNLACRFILQMTILLAKEEAMKTKTVY